MPWVNPGVLKALIVAGVVALAGCATAPPKTAPSAPGPSASSYVFLCQMAVSNAPPSGPDRRITGASEFISVENVRLLLAPATNACLSSGYGPRGGKAHKGIDYFARSGGAVLAAGDGVIREAATRADYGNMIVIEHKEGVYTRYAHLASFARGFAPGARVRRGDRLGPIGSSGAAAAPHLHYEILTGAFVSGVGSFGLKTHDPFALPAAR